MTKLVGLKQGLKYKLKLYWLSYNPILDLYFRNVFKLYNNIFCYLKSTSFITTETRNVFPTKWQTKIGFS